MLRFFLFKPTIQVIEEEKAQKAAIVDNIDQQKKSLEIQKRERQRHWYTCQEYFLLHQPQLRKTSFSPFISEQDYSKAITISEDLIAEIATDIHDLLKEKIKHVH